MPIRPASHCGFFRPVLLTVCLLGLVSRWAVLAADSDQPPAASSAITPEVLEWFERDVRPLLAEHCYSCHSSTVESPKGGLRLDSREGILEGGDSGPAAVAGNVDDSLIIDAVRRESVEMPPDKPLSARDQATLARWVELGLPWPEAPAGSTTSEGWVRERAAVHWAWHPPQPKSPPDMNEDIWSRRPMDRFIASELAANELAPTAACEPATLLRRLSFDLTGLPPNAQQVTEFNAAFNESSYSQLVDQLLSSPQFGVQWGRHWFDLVRYSETLGHEFDYPVRNAWQYRDATIDAINVDLSYADFVREHLAGDQIPHPRTHPLTGINQSLAATTWWWMGDSVHAPVDIRSDLATRTDNQIDVLSKAFLGMTIACARCHDHKFDAISLKDYYGLVGVIESSRRIYNHTDPLGKITQHQATVAEEVTAADSAARQAYAAVADQPEALREWIETLAQAVRAQPDKLDALLPATNPWFALRPLLVDDFAEGLKQARNRLNSLQSGYARWLEDSTLFADFSQGLPAGWYVQSPGQQSPSIATLARSVQPQPATFEWFHGRLPLPAEGGEFSSQRFGRRAHVTLRSPTFKAERPVICLKMQGKATQSMISVNNYYMHEFTGLLFSDLRKAIDQTTDTGWVTHGGNLNKYLGHPAFISIEDEGEAWFEIQEVRFADRGPPAEPSSLALQSLGGEFTTAAELFDLLDSNLQSSFKSIGSDQLDAAAITWVRSALQLSEALNVDLPLPQAELLSMTANRLQQLDASAPTPTTLTAISEGTPLDSAIAIRGNANQLGDVVPRGCFADLVETPAINQHSSGRWELAQAFTSPTHPLTSRVIVNRVWHHLLGRGLVSSTDNLGVLGGRPTHPALLDYLSTEFVKHDWSIKWLVREIVMSETYRLSSVPTSEQQLHDADGRLWSHRSVKRLTAESLRDTLLATAGSLNRNLAGPSTAIHLTEDMTGRGRPGSSGPLDGDNRRSVFIEVRRNFLDPFLLAFDFPMPSTCTGNRNVSNVPAQALGLSNDPLVEELAQRWAKQLLTLDDPTVRIESMFVTAFGRPPSAEETNECLSLITEAGPAEPQQLQAWIDLAHVLFNAKEFSYVR
jgi:hypothetical protein